MTPPAPRWRVLSRADAIELAGTPALVQSNFVSGLKTLPIRYRMH